MNMVGHDHKTNASCIERLQLMSQDTQDDLFWVIVIKQSATTFH